MTRLEQVAHNKRVIQRVTTIVRNRKFYATPSYKAVTGELNHYTLRSRQLSELVNSNCQAGPRHLTSPVS